MITTMSRAQSLFAMGNHNSIFCNYILFAHIANASPPINFPSPLGEWIGVRLWDMGGVSVLTYNHTTSSISLLYITDPTPNPSPTGAGNHCG